MDFCSLVNTTLVIEGGPSRNYHNTKAFMYAEPKAWFALMD
ncbi:uroporphyrinogen decarboxylase family protein, partial [Escherichia coli]